MFKRSNYLLTSLVLCTLALLISNGQAEAQRTQGGEQRGGDEIRVEGERAQALLIKSTVEHFQVTGLKVNCGDEWIDLQDGSIDEETLTRILEWSDWLTHSGADWVHVTNTSVVADSKLQDDVIESIESFSGAKADAFCSFLRQLGVIGL